MSFTILYRLICENFDKRSQSDRFSCNISREKVILLHKNRSISKTSRPVPVYSFFPSYGMAAAGDDDPVPVYAVEKVAHYLQCTYGSGFIFPLPPAACGALSSSTDESPGVGPSLNRSQHDAALPSTTPRQERKSSTDYSEPRHRTELYWDPRSRDARVKPYCTDLRGPNGLRRRTLRVKRD